MTWLIRQKNASPESGLALKKPAALQGTSNIDRASRANVAGAVTYTGAARTATAVWLSFGAGIVSSATGVSTSRRNSADAVQGSVSQIMRPS